MKIGDLKAMLQSRGLAPSHRLGQNFLVDPALLEAIPRDAGVKPGERVLEVGPGAGALTESLLAAGAKLLAVELDHGLADYLRERFATELESGQFQLVEGDALGPHETFHSQVESWWVDGPAPRLVANLPYAISGPFLGRLVGRPQLGATLLLQREVAEKAAFQGGAKNAGPLPIRLGLFFHVKMGRRLPPEVFWPRPKISSAFLHLEPRADAPSASIDASLKAILQLGFGQRRKALLSRLRKVHPLAAEALSDAGVDSTARPEVVPAALWLAAAEADSMGRSSFSEA